MADAKLGKSWFIDDSLIATMLHQLSCRHPKISNILYIQICTLSFWSKHTVSTVSRYQATEHMYRTIEPSGINYIILTDFDASGGKKWRLDLGKHKIQYFVKPTTSPWTEVWSGLTSAYLLMVDWHLLIVDRVGLRWKRDSQALLPRLAEGAVLFPRPIWGTKHTPLNRMHILI